MPCHLRPEDGDSMFLRTLPSTYETQGAKNQNVNKYKILKGSLLSARHKPVVSKHNTMHTDFLTQTSNPISTNLKAFPTSKKNPSHNIVCFNILSRLWRIESELKIKFWIYFS
jgi:hypothetical protein